MSKILEIYTDGSAGPTNPGPGGFGVIAVQPNEVKDKIILVHSERHTETTNNRMEMMAILYAYEKFGININSDNFVAEKPKIYSDSSYVVNTFNDWIFDWVRRGWKKANNQTPENMDLLLKFIDLYESGLRMDLIKIKGHAGNKYNEMADLLAKGKVKYVCQNKGYDVEFINSKFEKLEVRYGGN